MRKVLFKGKSEAGYKWITKGEWIEGSLLQSEGEKGTACQIVTSYLPNEKNEPVMAVAYEVNPETVCQYTGFTDENRVKIFEGDYISDGETVWEVVYCKSMSGFSAKAAGGRIPDECGWFSLYHLCNGHHGGRKVRVVGNRYEYKGNPSDLLSRDVEEEERTQP